MVSPDTPAILTEVLTVPTSDGVSLRVERRTAEAKGLSSAGLVSICLAHGFGQTRLAWDRSAGRLAEQGYEVISADTRGHGDSERNPTSLRYDGMQLLADVSVVAAQARSTPVWVGASLGGILGLMAATAEEAAPFSALVLVDITPKWNASGVERILQFMKAHPDGFESIEAAADAVMQYLPQRPRKSANRLRSLLREGGDGRLRWHWDPRLLSELDVDSPQWSERLADAAGRLQIPTLLVSGGQSDLIGDEQVEHFLQLAPHARHVRLPAATHMVVGDDNDAFTDALLEFLPTVGLPADIHRDTRLRGHVSGVTS